MRLIAHLFVVLFVLISLGSGIATATEAWRALSGERSVNSLHMFLPLMIVSGACSSLWALGFTFRVMTNVYAAPSNGSDPTARVIKRGILPRR